MNNVYPFLIAVFSLSPSTIVLLLFHSALNISDLLGGSHLLANILNRSNSCDTTM